MLPFSAFSFSKIVEHGMSDKVGQIVFKLPTSSEVSYDKPYSDTTAQLIDDEARQIIDEAYKATLALIQEKKEQVIKVIPCPYSST